MDLLMILFLAFAMCMMLASIVAGGYVLLTKPQATESQPLLSADDLDALAGKLDAAENAAQYSNVLNARIGFDSGSGIIKTASLAPSDCQTLCVGTANCQGFQISDQNGCSLLANVTTTYGFEESGINLFTVPLKIPSQVFGQPRQGNISGDDVAFVSTAAPSPSIRTKHECAKVCHDSDGCKSFSVSPTAGCHLASATAADADVYSETDWNSYFLKDVKHSTGWSWKTPAPSPSPR